MGAFAALLDDLVYIRSRNVSIKLIADYLLEAPDPGDGGHTLCFRVVQNEPRSCG
jgi:hypothetical protein